MPKDQTGTTWVVDTLPCPECGLFKVVGILLVSQEGSHMHTKYMCTYWETNDDLINNPTKPCGWTGWSVPGWNNA